jgi:hypothetical protein
MQIEFDKKTNEVKITMSINPKSTQLSSSKKTYIVGSDGAKFDVDGRSIRVQVNAFSPVEGGGGKKKK